MAYKVTTDPATEPITLTEAKNWLKISGTADDSIITMLIESTRQTLEDQLDLKYITQTITQKLDTWPIGGYIELDIGPVQSVTNVIYKNGAGTETLSSDSYTLDDTSAISRLYLNDGYTWPTLKAEKEAITITYVAGFGAASDVPAKLKQLMLHALAFAYENRMNPVQQRVTYIDKLVYLHRNWSFK